MKRTYNRNGILLIGPKHKPWKCDVGRCGMRHNTSPEPVEPESRPVEHVVLDAIYNLSQLFRRERIARGDAPVNISYNTRPDQSSVPVFKNARYLGSMTTTRRVSHLAAFMPRHTRIGRVCGAY